MGNSEFDDVAAHLLEPEESLDSEQTGIDLNEGYSPPESPRELGAWGLTASEARTHESLARRLAREVPDVTDRWDGDGIGDIADSDGEPIDDQVATAVQVGSSPSASTPQIPLPITAPTMWGSTAALRRLRKRPCISSPMTTIGPRSDSIRGSDTRNVGRLDRTSLPAQCLTSLTPNFGRRAISGRQV